MREEQGYKRINGVDHFYRTLGTGETFVVLHGGPGMYHDELVPFFADFARSRRVLFYDQRGNGRSLLKSIDSTTFNVDLLVDDLEQLRLAFGIENLNLIGHSWGGLLAMYYAAAHPDQLKRLIMIASAPVNTELLIQSYKNQVSMYSEEMWVELQQLWESEAYLAGEPEVHNTAMRMAEGVLFYDKANIDRYMAAAAFDPITAKNAVLLNGLARDIKLNIHVQDSLSRILCPTLIVHAQEDFIVPDAPRLANKLIPNSELVLLKQSGHYPHIEVPEALFGAIERFIERTQ